jgi:hypothetical protein
MMRSVIGGGGAKVFSQVRVHLCLVGRSPVIRREFTVDSSTYARSDCPQYQCMRAGRLNQIIWS